VFELQVFADSLGIDWSFQDGQFVGADKGQPYDGQGPLLTSATGLLDARLDAKGNVEGSALLLPDLIPGVGFRIGEGRAAGDYVAVATHHTGDNFDETNWVVRFHGIPLGALSDGLLPPSEVEKAKLKLKLARPTAPSTVL
jgi:hypothetical protein